MDAIELCAWVVDRVKQEAPHRLLQGERRPPFPNHVADAAVRLVATTRIRAVAESPARALVALANGERPAQVITRALPFDAVLSLQAQGERCVSVLANGEDVGPHGTPLGFLLHDLCHLEKFVDRSNYAGQVGFFHAVSAARRSAAFEAIELEIGGDPAWREDFAHVVADMNGSCIFLFAALKMKLKMAARRLVRGDVRRREDDAYEALLEKLLVAMDLGGPLAAAARAVSTRRDAEDAARLLLTDFERRGRDVLRNRGVGRIGRLERGDGGT